jgi:hypothetical protein
MIRFVCLYSMIFFVLFFQTKVVVAAEKTVLDKVNVPLTEAYIPIGFDEINRTQVTVEGVFPDTCYRVSHHRVQIDGKKITVTQEANRYKGVCADMLVPFSQVVDLGILQMGDYSVVDGKTGRVLGTLPISKAPHKSSLTYPDDYLYAPVSDAYILVDSGKKTLVISGGFTDNCTKFTDIKVDVKNGKVIQVLPITERSGTCTRMYKPYQISKVITVPDGHYLLHVRSLSGNAVNKMVDAFSF